MPWPIYGKLFVDLDASARGPMKHFDVNANLSVLNSTDINYQLQTDAQTLVEQQSKGEVVTFVQFSDTTQVQKTDSVETQMAMRIIASLNIAPGTGPPSSFPTKAPTGWSFPRPVRFGISELHGRHAPHRAAQSRRGIRPLRPACDGREEVRFRAFEPVCLWNGDIMNPLLHIDAYDDVKVNVVQPSGNTSLVDFKVNLSVSNTLSAPKVAFDLSSDDDITIRNELQSMVPTNVRSKPSTCS